MPEQELAGGIEATIAVSAEQVERPLEDVAAQHAADMDAVQTEHGAEMSKEARCAQIGEALLTLATTDPDGEQYLAEYLEHTAFPDGTNECLLNFETEKRVDDPNYDVTQEQPRRLAFVLRRGLQASVETVDDVTLAETDAETETVADVETDVATETEGAWATVSSSPEYQNAKDNADKIAILLGTEGLPEEIKVRVQAFSQILAIADRVPADAPIVRQRINQLDLSQGVPDPVQFVRAFIFDNSTSNLPSGVSEATQQAVAESLGISRPDVEVTTGSEMTDVFEKGVGSQEVRDPETGEIRIETLYLQPGEFAPLNDNQSIGLTESGDRAMRFDEEVGSFTVILPDNATSEDMAMYGLAGQMMSQLHDVNMAEMIYPGRNMLERGGGVLDIRLPDDFNPTQQLCQIFFGEFAGYDGTLLNQSDLDRIPYLMQFQNEKGDAVIGDVNPDQMRADYQRQGIIDANGSFDWDRFAGMVEGNRLGLWTGEENHARSAA